MEKLKLRVKCMQDNDGDLFWLHEEMVSLFEKLNTQMESADYIDNPDLFDLFSHVFGPYATGGAMGIKPEVFKDIPEGVEIIFVQ